MLRSRCLFNSLALAAGLAFLGFAAGAVAQTNWTGSAGSDWDNPGNWDAGGVPTAAVDAYINGGANDPGLNADGAARYLYLGTTSAGRLTISSDHSLTVSTIYLGQATGTTSDIVQSVGTLTCNGYIWAGSTGGNGADPTQTGSGNYTMTGGTLNANNFDFGQLGTAAFYQSGGEVNVGFAAFGENYFRFANGIPATPGQTVCTLEGNALFNSGDTFIGLWGGYATLTIQGSAVMNATSLGVDSHASWCPLGATGEINLHNSGQILLSNKLSLSGNPVASGTLNQDGGTLTVPTLDRGLGTGTYNFTGGTLNVSEVNNMDLVNGGGTVNVGGVGALATLKAWGTEMANNIALGKTATESSVIAAAELAVDGVFSNYCHTNSEENAWWKVDLTGGGTTNIRDVLLTGRTGYTGFLSNFHVRVLGDDGATVLWQDKFIAEESEILADGEKLWVELPGGVDGRYVQVQLDAYNLDPWGYGWGGYLVFAECEVNDVVRYAYSQDADSTLGIELDPTNNLCDKLIVGTLTLDGTLDVTSLGGDFSAGQVFDILDWDTLVGAFDTVNLPTLSGGLSWDTSQLYLTGQLAVVPEPSSGVLLLLGLFGATVSVRRRGR